MNVKPDVHSMNVRKWPKSIIYFGVGTRRSPESDQRPEIVPVCHPIAWPATSLQPLPVAAEPTALNNRS
jgi:hypothetical protein